MKPLNTSLFLASLRPGLLVAIVIIAVSGLLPQRSNAEGIDWTIAPYFWGSGVGLDVTINDDPVIGTDVPLSDLIDKLDGVFMGHFEGRGERFGVFVDTIYLSLADQRHSDWPGRTDSWGFNHRYESHAKTLRARRCLQDRR